MEEEAKPQPKISDFEVILIGGVCLLFDVIELALLFFALDDFWILDTFASAIAIYFWFKGVNAIRYVVTWILELIPWVGGLPLKTIGFAMTVYLDRHPKLAAVAEKAAAAKGGVKSPGGKGEVAAEVKGRAGGEGPVLPAERTGGEERVKKPFKIYSPEGEASSADAEEGAGSAPEETEVTEEAFGVEEGEIEKLIDITRRIPKEEEYKKAA